MPYNIPVINNIHPLIPYDNQLSYTSIPRNKDLKLDITNHCDFPSYVLVIDRNGECFVCACEAWLPISVGNIMNFSRLEDIWLSPVARNLQEDINSQKFTHCAVDRCGVLTSDRLTKKYAGVGPAKVQDKSYQCYYISINIDDSCNLSCPSCRSQPIMTSSGVQYDQRLAMVNHVVNLLQNFDYPTHIIMSGNGDPLASNIMRPLLHSYQPKSYHSLRLFTNGLLLSKQLDNNPIVNNITQYYISIDAGSADVYEQVRQPGRFDQLIKNLDFLRDLSQQTNAQVLLKFVLQKDNWHDQQPFVDLCTHYGFQGIINRLEDWGTWSNYANQDVIGNRNHPEHQQSIAELKQVHSRVKKENLNIIYNASLERICNESN
jgi:MoaA/NifB/PqqE/SkfB family radical SAM enzyme